MVIVQDVKLIESQMLAEVSLFADTKEEVTNDIQLSIPEGYSIRPGSSVMTANGEMAFRKSDGTWNWV